MNCSVNDNCQISDGECAEICQAHYTAGFIAWMATAAFVFALAAFLVCLIFP